MICRRSTDRITMIARNNRRTHRNISGIGMIVRFGYGIGRSVGQLAGNTVAADGNCIAYLLAGILRYLDLEAVRAIDVIRIVPFGVLNILRSRCRIIGNTRYSIKISLCDIILEVNSCRSGQLNVIGKY